MNNSATAGLTARVAIKALSCNVLNDGMRVLGAEDLLRAFVGSYRGAAKEDTENHPPAFLAHKNLQPFISKELLEGSAPVHFRTEDGEVAFGYRAQVLPGVCNVYLSARDEGKLRKTQKALARLSYHLVRELATLGVIALIDAASNYRELCHSPAVLAMGVSMASVFCRLISSRSMSVFSARGIPVQFHPVRSVISGERYQDVPRRGSSSQQGGSPGMQSTRL